MCTIQENQRQRIWKTTAQLYHILPINRGTWFAESYKKKRTRQKEPTKKYTGW
jgi:hypothetical protein